jgi:hypothetical protein
MITSKIVAACFLVIASVIIPGARAESILNRVPHDAIGFVLVRNLAAADAKIAAVSKIFEGVSPTPIPAPLELVKASTGLGPGINEQGDAVLALLPGSNGLNNPVPVLLVSVSNYEQFAAAVQGDATGDISRVSIAGEEVLAARLGEFAVLMNVEHRERLQALLLADAGAHPGIEPLNEWLQTTDAAVVLTPTGVDMLAAAGQATMAEQTALEQNLPAESFRELQQSMKFYQQTLGFLGTEIDAAAAGIAIDDATNVKLVSRAMLTQKGRLASFAGQVQSMKSALTGYAEKPYVLAAAAETSADLLEAIAKLNRDLLEANPQSHGFENLTADDWQAYEDSWKSYMRGITSASLVAYLGDDKDPLVSNLAGLLEVDDSAAYLKSYRESIDAWNKLLAKTTFDIKLEYVLTDAEVSGRKGLLTTIDLGKAADDPNVPMIKFMADALLGEDGQLRITLAAVDDDTVLFGIDDDEDLKQAVEAAAESKAGLVESSDVQTTTGLLDESPTAAVLLSPQGTVAWCGRLYNKLLAQLGPGNLEFPKFPESPPIGLTLTLSERHIGGEIVWPKETLEGLATFLKNLQQGFGP